MFTDFSGTVATLQKSDNPVLQTLGNAIETIRSTFDAIVGLFVNFSGTVATLQESDNPVLQVLGSALATIKGVIDAIVSAFTSGISDAINTLQQSDNPVLQVLGDALSTIKNTIDAIIGFFNTGFSEAVKKLQESDNPVLKVLGDSIAAIKSTIDGVSSAVETVIGWFQKLLGYDGKNLASTTSTHTHTETTVKKVVNADGTTSTIKTDGQGRESRIDSDGSGGASRGFAKGSVFIPNDMTAMLHRGEMVLTASQARKYREAASGIDYGNLAQVVAQAVREGMAGVSVNSYLDAELVTESVNRRIGNELVSRRYAT